MQGPQLIIEMSSRMLTQALHNGIGMTLDCPIDPGLYTDVNIRDLVAFRGDDPKLGPLVESIATQLPATISLETMTRQDVHTANGSGSLFLVPGVFILVSGTVRLFANTELDQRGTSSPVSIIPTPNDPFQLEFTRFPRFSPDPLFRVHFPPLLFQVNSLSLDPGSATLNCHLQFVSVFTDAPLTSTDAYSTLRVEVAVPELRKRLSDFVVPLPLGGLLKSLGTSISVVNHGITTEAWVGTPGDLGGPGTGGIRIALDVTPPDDDTGWRAFHQPTPFAFQVTNQEEWTVFLKSDFLVLAAEQNVRKNLQPTDSVKFGPGRATEASGSWDGSQLNVQSPVFETVGLGVQIGSVNFTQTPSLGQLNMGQVNPPSTIHVHTCIDFNLSLLFGALVAIGSIGVGAIIGGPLGALLGAIAGIAGDIGISSKGQQTVNEKLGSVQTTYCSDPKDNCLDCNLVIDQSIPNLGELKLRRLTKSAAGLVLAGSIDWMGGKGDALLLPGSMEVEIRPGWGFFGAACGSYSGPSKLFWLTNTGELPLKICEPTQRPTAMQDDNILGDPTAVQPLGQPESIYFPITLAAGQTVPLFVTARISKHPHYRPDLPLLLRILSSGGARVINCNEGTPAAFLDPQKAAGLKNSLDEYCKSLNYYPVHFIRQWSFPDPVPFQFIDRLRERLIVQISELPDGLTLQGISILGQRLGQSIVSQGTALLDLDQERAQAATHENAQLFLQFAALPKLGNSEPLPGPRSLTNQPFLRILYREGPWYSVNRPILGAVRLDRHLVVLTEDSLRIGTISIGRISAWKELQIPSPFGLARLGEQIVVATSHELISVDTHLHVLWQHKGNFRAVAAHSERLWAADERGILEMRVDEQGRILEHRGFWLPGVSQMLAFGHGLFALARRHVWRVGVEELHDLDVEADRLSEVSGLLLAERYRSAIVIDGYGRQHAEYVRSPWSTSIIEWPDVAVEVRQQQGLLVLHERYETRISASGSTEEIVRQIDGLPQA